MKAGTRPYFLFAAVCTISCFFLIPASPAQDTHFHNAPASSNQLKNPFAGQLTAIVAGAKLYAMNCGACHGNNGRGTGNIPPLSQGATQTVSDGEVFWFITTGSVNNGMPSWATMPEEKRWQIVTYLKSLKNSPNARNTAPLPASVKPVRAQDRRQKGPLNSSRKPGSWMLTYPIHLALYLQESG